MLAIVTLISSPLSIFFKTMLTRFTTRRPVTIFKHQIFVSLPQHLQKSEDTRPKCKSVSGMPLAPQGVSAWGRGQRNIMAQFWINIGNERAPSFLFGRGGGGRLESSHPKRNRYMMGYIEFRKAPQFSLHTQENWQVWHKTSYPKPGEG